MAKDPAVLFYSNDFLSGTFTLTNEQVGKYIRLLCIQHQKGFLNEKDMMNICKSYDEDIFLKFENQDGKYVNLRMLQESEKRRLYSESRRKNREKVVSDIKTDISEKDMIPNEKTYVKHMENENENIDVIENKNEMIATEKKIDFDLLLQHWNNFAKQVGIPEIKAITDERKKKILSRASESNFDFMEIVNQIQQSDFLLGKVNGFKVSFDWIFKSPKNYLKIIEGNYKNAKSSNSNGVSISEHNQGIFSKRSTTVTG
jgi:uncharacterized protein YdaU (DUF1376 family)